MEEVRCPRCGSKNFKICRLIYESGTRTHSFSSSTGTNSSSRNSNLLAQSVAPPEPPNEPQPYPKKTS